MSDSKTYKEIARIVGQIRFRCARHCGTWCGMSKHIRVVKERIRRRRSLWTGERTGGSCRRRQSTISERIVGAQVDG